MHVLWSLMVGSALGALAYLLASRTDSGGLVANALLGSVGALLADAVVRTPGVYQRGGPTAGIVAPVLGAVVFLGCHLAARRRAEGRRTERHTERHTERRSGRQPAASVTAVERRQSPSERDRSSSTSRGA
jgi:uncharacterized membrane protein YeaQ/YmgE (transglycosylase-associated protein family)